MADRKKRTPMPEQDPKERIKNFSEVALGYSAEDAIAEAARCIQCKSAPCTKGCPVEIPIPEFIKLTAEGDFKGAIDVIKSVNDLPAICGRVCPQENQCEQECTLGRKGEPIAIGRLERFLADWEEDSGSRSCAVGSSGYSVAVIGSGPAGLTCAGQLARMGHKVTIFESLHAPGGVLMYGIPEFRLPKEVVQREINCLKYMDVEIVTNVVVGKTVTIDELLENGYQAVFIGTGAGLPYFLGIPGEHLNGVFSANEFLTRCNLMRARDFPEYDTPIGIRGRVAVIGAGNVSMDAARTAVRLGAEKVFIIYRRSRDEMPAREEEIEHALEEGIEFHLLTTPIQIVGDENGRVMGIECIGLELCEPDQSGRRRPVPKDCGQCGFRVDTVVMAVGQGINPLVTSSTEGLKVSDHGTIVVDENMATTKKGVFAGGDVTSGAATVISAMGAGKQAAKSIDKYLRETYGKQGEPR